MARQGLAGNGTAWRRAARCGRRANGTNEQERERSERRSTSGVSEQERERSERDVDSERSELAVNVFYFS